MSNYDIQQAMDDLINALLTYEPLTAFCLEKWSKGLQVKQVYKKRTELSASDDLPIILVVWPGDTEEDSIDTHLIKLHAVFHQEDAELGAQDTISLQRLIRAAIMQEKTRNKYALFTRKGGVATDEGKFHPFYASTREVELELPTYD